MRRDGYQGGKGGGGEHESRMIFMGLQKLFIPKHTVTSRCKNTLIQQHTNV